MHQVEHLMQEQLTSSAVKCNAVISEDKRHKKKGRFVFAAVQ